MSMSREIELDGGKIRELRKALGKKQAETAKAAGITQAQLSRLERGWPSTYQTAERLADVLGVEVGWLLKKMPGDVRRDPDDLRLAWLDLIQGKTRELRASIGAGEVSSGTILSAEWLYRDVEKYAGRKLGMHRGDGRISLALDELWSTVSEAHMVAAGDRPNPEAAVAAAIAEEEAGARKTA